MKKTDKITVGMKAVYCELNKKLVLGTVSVSDELHYTIQWESGMISSSLQGYDIPFVQLLTDEEARNFFPDRFDSWPVPVVMQFGDLPGTPKKKAVPVVQYVIAACLTLAMISWAGAKVANFEGTVFGIVCWVMGAAFCHSVKKGL